MGSGRWDSTSYAGHSSSAAAYDAFATRSATLSAKEIFTKREMSRVLDPMHVAVRESRDSVDNPESTPVIVGVDVTGSMHTLAEIIAKKGLGVLFAEVFKRKPVTDPHIMFMAIGDAECDSAPLQVSQFEADGRIIEQLTEIFVERGGGGNGTESYQFPWYFAAMHTAHDAFEKRGKKGYLFTVGDEEAPEPLTAEAIKRFTGDEASKALSAAELLGMAQTMYHVFHVVVEEGHHYMTASDKVRKTWGDLMGQNVLYLSDHTKLAEVIVSAIQITEGADHKTVAASWSGDTSLVVANATRALSAAKVPAAGVVRF